MAKAPANEAAPAKKGKGKLIIIIVVVLLVLGGGGFAGVYMFTDLITGPKEPPPVTVTPPTKVEEMESKTINLANGSGFLKIRVAVELNPASPLPEFVKAPVDNETIKLFSRLTLEQLQDPAVREAAKLKLLDRLQEVYGKDKILDVYYTEFVMQ